MEQLKVGFIVDDKIASKYIYDLAEWCNSQSEIDVPYLIIQKSNINSSKAKILFRILTLIKEKRVLRFLQLKLFSFISFIESILLKKIKAHMTHFDKLDLSKLIPHSLEINPEISKSGFIFRYPKKDIDKVKSLNLDLLIRFGSGILRGDILEASKLGVISFHHGDNRINRGGPPGFWEVYYKEDSTGFIIQKLTEELDGGQVLVHGTFPTKSYYLHNLAFLYKKSYVYMNFLLKEIALHRRLPAARESEPYYNRLFKLPKISEQIIYLIRFFHLKVSESISYRLFQKSYRWGVAFIRGDWKNIVMWRAIRIKNPVNHFLADPFVISKQDKDYCFVEDYDYEKGRGCIAVYELKEKTSERLGDVIVEPFHLSFPYLFEFDSKLYMCPDTSEINEIRLYECINFPLDWKYSRTLMHNVNAADTMIFKENNTWWLFSNIDPSNIGDHCSELFIYSAENPLSSNWKPHNKNPIFVDSNKARNAGILFQNGLPFRVAQKQGFNMYGKSFSINKINILNNDEYSESKLSEIKPYFFPNTKGTHHMHSNNKITVFDFVENIRFK